MKWIPTLSDALFSSSSSSPSSPSTSSAIRIPSKRLKSLRIMDRSTSSPSPRSHSDRLCVWAVDISGWAESLDTDSPSPSSSDDGHSSSSSTTLDRSRRGYGSPVDKVIQELLGSRHHGIVSEDMTRATTKIRKYLREVDRVRSLAGQLLPRVMYMHQYPDRCTWSNLKFDATEEKRPFLAEPAIPSATDYNVTHDEDWIALAFHAPSADKKTSYQDIRADKGLLSSVSALSLSSHRSQESTASLSSSAPVSPYSSTLSSPASSIYEEPMQALRVGIDVMAVSLPHYDPTIADFVSMMELAMTPGERKWVLSADPDADEEPHDYFSGHERGATPKSGELKAEEHEMLMRLYDLWTYKEAFTKNVGRGLGFDFSTIEVAFWRCPEVPLPALPASEQSNSKANKVDRAARQHASRISAGQPGVGSTQPILTLAGEPEGRYSFVEIHLPASKSERGDVGLGATSSLNKARATRSRARSQLVVCEGPYPEGTLTSGSSDDDEEDDGSTDLVQVAPALDAADAIEAGLLRVWTMQELVEEARKLRRAERYFSR
ncbi:hypothetical protein A4X09_0g5480 [Tilletia walkeri]|uniref:holo-[acyl-carrier-protein] synthase n=1 Tax=Tilletia walkeri TaxID=117179 RepID=A0A8X7N734_9BASI|nr:hypothetical protein A4X09_0g5480 [Tilletia walkeri]